MGGIVSGVAFCLEVLGQWEKADSLHWINSVHSFIKEERDKVRYNIGPRGYYYAWFGGLTKRINLRVRDLYYYYLYIKDQNYADLQNDRKPKTMSYPCKMGEGGGGGG